MVNKDLHILPTIFMVNKDYHISQTATDTAIVTREGE